MLVCGQDYLKKIIGVFKVVFFFFFLPAVEKKAGFFLNALVRADEAQEEKIRLRLCLLPRHFALICYDDDILTFQALPGTVRDVQSRAKLNSPPSIRLKDLISAQHH